MCSVKKVFLEISHNSQEKICAKVSFLIKLQVLKINLYVFNISENFSERLFYRKPFNNCLYFNQRDIM